MPSGECAAIYGWGGNQVPDWQSSFQGRPESHVAPYFKMDGWMDG